MIRDWIITLILASGILISSFCYTGDSFGAQTIRVVEGKISAIDTFKSTVTVKFLIISPVIVYNEIIIFIGPNTKIMRSGSTMNIFDLGVSNTINVKYIEKDSGPEALSITVIKWV